MRRLLVLRILVAVVVLACSARLRGLVIYKMFPVQWPQYGGSDVATSSFPRLRRQARLTTEANPDYRAVQRSAGAPDRRRRRRRARLRSWPSYNRTLTSDRFSPLGEIDASNVGQAEGPLHLRHRGYEAFESGLIMVEGALIGTTQFDIFSLDPATCAENWRTHEDYPAALLPANRGAAYLDGMLFRGTQDGRVLAYDFKTGERIWATTIADPKLGETVPSAPIAWDGLVFVGHAGGDFKGGKGHMFALDAKTGKIVWEFFLVPQVEGDIVRGPLGDVAARRVDLGQPGRHSDQRWRHLDVVHARPGDRAALCPRRQSGARLRARRARGRRTSTPTRSSSSTPGPATTRRISSSCRRTGTTGTSPTRRS